LIRLLSGSTQFRVRAQAAISLGGVEGSGEAVDALMKALSDEHPAVRAAAANSLGHLGDQRALRALRAKAADPEPPVQLAVRAAISKLESEQRKGASEVEPPRGPAGPPRYYVAIGKPGSRLPEVTSGDIALAEQTLRARVAELDGVVLAAGEETPNAVRSVLRTRKLKGFYIDSAVTSVAQTKDGLRVAVSVIVATYPDRAMRAIMQGAATVPPGGGDAKAQAVAVAVKTALKSLPKAMSQD
jgi:hypothetical protein